MSWAERSPCTETVPLMSPARATPLNSRGTKQIAASTTALMTCFIQIPLSADLSFSSYRTIKSSKYKVSPDNKPVGTEESNCSGDWLLEAALILKRQLDIGADQHLNPGAKAVSGSRARNPVQEIGWRIHNVVAHQTDQPRIHPVFSLRKTAAERHGRRRYKACSTRIESLVRIVTVHPEPP